MSTPEPACSVISSQVSPESEPKSRSLRSSLKRIGFPNRLAIASAVSFALRSVEENTISKCRVPISERRRPTCSRPFRFNASSSRWPATRPVRFASVSPCRTKINFNVHLLVGTKNKVTDTSSISQLRLNYPPNPPHSRSHGLFFCYFKFPNLAGVGNMGSPASRVAMQQLAP